MSTADKLNKILETKAAIKQAIVNKGVEVSDDAVFSDYPAKINAIEVGSGGGETYENPEFYESLTDGGTNYKYLFAYKTFNDASPVESLGTSKVKDMSHAFDNFISSSLDLTGWNVSNATNISYMFASAKISELDVTGWDISNVTNMQYIFQYSELVTITGLDTWDTSNITNMNYMFFECKKLASIDVSNWNTFKVTNMSRMFYQCDNLETLDISGWDTSNVKEFASVYSFIQGTSSSKLTAVIGELDLSSCTSGMMYSATYYCFKTLPKLETLYLKNIYKNVTMKNELKWSIYLGDTKVKDECLIYIINELPDLINDKGLTATDKIVFTLPKTNTLTAEQVQVAIDKGWNVANTTY